LIRIDQNSKLDSTRGIAKQCAITDSGIAEIEALLDN